MPEHPEMPKYPHGTHFAGRPLSFFNDYDKKSKIIKYKAMVLANLMGPTKTSMNNG
jgi:hypothetical protein